MCAENLTVLGIANDFDEAFGFASSTSATVGHERKFADLVVDLLFLDLGFSHADRRHFGVAVRRVGNVAVVHRVRMWKPSEELGEDDAFAHALVREHWRTRNVADGVDA